MKRLLSMALCLVVGAGLALASGAQERPDPTAAPSVNLDLMEAPEFAEMVAAGELPPVGERLPENPVVLDGVDGLGSYGSAWRQVHLGANDRFQNMYHIQEHLGEWNKEFSAVVPSVAESWEWSNGGRTITFTLREGMKWSDGDDFDTDDFAFWYNDVLMNDELGQDRSVLSVGGRVAEFEQIDDLRFRFNFAEPNYIFEELLPSYLLDPIMPSHYLKQFHPAYADMEDIEAAMADAGFEVWSEFFTKLFRFMDPNAIGVPTIRAWYQTNGIDEPVQVLARNPYYWKVDTAGRQLPYLDRIERRLMSDVEAMTLAALAGEVDLQFRRVDGVARRPAAVENQVSGNYTIVDVGAIGFQPWVVYFNWYQDDQLKADLYADLRFRRALSIGMNREQINDLVYKGLGNPSNSQVGPTYIAYDETTANMNAEYDPVAAAALLDEVGLTETDSDGFRLRPDTGDRLTLVVNLFQPGLGFGPEVWEIIKTNWAEIGIDVAIRPTERSLWHEARSSYDFDLSSYQGQGARPGNSSYLAAQVYAAHGEYTYWGQKWADWLMSDGATGVEPPDDVKRIYEIYLQMPSVASRADRADLEREVQRTFAEQLYIIGTLNEPSQGRFGYRHNTFMNVDTDVEYYSSETQNPPLFYRAAE